MTRRLVVVSILTLVCATGCSSPLPVVPGPPGSAKETEHVPSFADIAKAEAVDYCRLVANGAAYDGKVVRVAAHYLAGFEASILLDYRCDLQQTWVTFDWPSVESLSTTGALANYRAAQEERRLLKQRTDMDSDLSLDVVFIGRFDGVRHNGWGYGHMNARDFQLTVLALEHAAVPPEWRAWLDKIESGRSSR